MSPLKPVCQNNLVAEHASLEGDDVRCWETLAYQGIKVLGYQLSWVLGNGGMRTFLPRAWLGRT